MGHGRRTFVETAMHPATIKTTGYLISAISVTLLGIVS
jgi:hypothetical protein